MHPILLEVFNIKIKTYGFMIAIGFLVAIFWGRKLFRQEKIEEEHFINLAFLCLVAGVFGSRVFNCLVRWDSFEANPISFFYIWQGGLVFYGGLIFAGTACMIYIRKNNLPFWKTIDILSMLVAVAYGFTRIGCFFAGCCHGKATDSFLGMKFNSELVEPSLRGIPIHPTQIYESFSSFVILVILFLIYKKQKFVGNVFVVYIILYSIARALVEILRGDSGRGFMVDDWMSTSQFISVFTIIIGIIFYFVRKKSLYNEAIKTNAKSKK